MAGSLALFVDTELELPSKPRQPSKSRTLPALRATLGRRLLTWVGENAVRTHYHATGVDFLNPKGAPALYAPTSLSWRVYKNPVSMAIGGIAAVLLELAEPRVRSGIWDHSNFATATFARIRRTGVAALTTIYAPSETATDMIQTVRRMHDRVQGVTPNGVAYRANNPVLLDWVQATVSFGFLEAYCAFVHPFNDEERDRFYSESEPSARLFGAIGAPRSVSAMRRQLERMKPALEPHPIVHEFMSILSRTPLLPRGLRPLQQVVLRAAVSILPDWLARRLELAGSFRLRPGEKRLLQTLGAAADRIPLIHAPPAQASLRLGLPFDYLYRGPRDRISA